MGLQIHVITEDFSSVEKQPDDTLVYLLQMDGMNLILEDNDLLIRGFLLKAFQVVVRIRVYAERSTKF